MLTLIFKLPEELCTIIVEQLCHLDLVRLSSTSKSCREHFAPLIFHTIRFGNDNKTADSALVAVKEYGKHVRRLEFSYVAEPGNVSDGKVLPPLEPNALLPATRELLKGCDTAENADVVSLSLRFDVSREGCYNDWNRLSDERSSTELSIETERAEERFRWRAVLNEAYQATAENSIVRKIELVDMIAIPVSAFYTPAFGKLLGRLTSATIKIFIPGDECGGFRVPGHRDFVAKMHEIFFSHMHQLTSLELTAPWGYPLGGREPVFPLRRRDLPLLQSLKLNHSFTCPQLLEFIKAHSVTLSSLTLVDCVRDYESAAERGYPNRSETWAYFFFDITVLRLPALVNLSIEYKDDVLTKFYNDNDFPDREQQRTERIKADELERCLTKDPERKVFAYVGLDEHATMIVNAFVNRAQATKLDDYYEYQRLMRLVKENAHRIARDRNQSSAV
ncbi:hypothetical protein MY3296_008684 [Beauveria thailandica]